METSLDNTASFTQRILSQNHISKLSLEALKTIDQRRKGLVHGLKSSWPAWNLFMGGCFSFGTFYVIGGRPGTGKSNRALQLLDDFCSLTSNLEWKNKVVVLFWSAEMAAEQNVLRLFSKYTKHSLYKLQSTKDKLTDAEYDQVKRMADRFANYPFYIVDTPISGNKMYQVNDQLVRGNPDLRVVNLVDHSRLIPGTDEKTEEERISNLCVMMNTSTKVHKSSWILLSQLNRNIESVERRRESSYPWPMAYGSDFFGADAVQQNAHVASILLDPYEFCKRPTVSKNDTEIALKKLVQNGSKVFEHRLLIDYIVKNRNGAMGEIYNEVCWATNTIKELGTQLNTGLPNEFTKTTDTPPN